MADPTRAIQLISSDEHSPTRAQQPYREYSPDIELHDRRRRRSTSSSAAGSFSKGKAKAYDPPSLAQQGTGTGAQGYADGVERSSSAEIERRRRESYDDEEDEAEDSEYPLDPHSSAAPRALRQRRMSLSKEQIRVQWWKDAAINVLFIGAWYIFSTLISVYNKWMFSPDHYNFPYPLFVTSFHMLAQWLLAALTLSIFPKLRPKEKPTRRNYGTKVVPCGMATGLDIGLSNLSLRTITLSFYTMCKSSSLAFVLMFAFLFKLEQPSWRLVGIIGIITAGVVLMVSTETQFDFVGMVEVLTASALGGLRWSLTQLLLDKQSMGMHNPFATLFWLAPVMGVTLATCSLLFDGWITVLKNPDFFGDFFTSLKTMAFILLPGALAFMMNVTEFGLIQRTSVVTLSVAGIFKEVAVIFVSTVIFGDRLTPINISGLCVTIFGIALYNYLKYRQYTSGEAIPHGHGGGGGHGKRVEDDGFVPLGGGAGSGHRRGRSSQVVFNAADESFAEDRHPAAPHHALGDDDDDDDEFRSSSSSRDSLALPSKSNNPYMDEEERNESSLHLRRTSISERLHEHDGDEIRDFDKQVHTGKVAALDRAEHQLEAMFDANLKEHASAGAGRQQGQSPPDGWEDLLDESRHR